MVFGLLPLPPPLPFLALRASCSSPAADASASCRGGGGRLVVRLSVWVVCLVVAPWVVVCRNGNGGWIAASTPSPTLPRCGLRPAGEGVVRRGMLSGCRFGLCVWSLLRGLFAAPTPALHRAPRKMQPHFAWVPAHRGREQFGGGMLSGCRFGLCVWSLLRGLWCAETAMAVGLLPLPPPRPSPAAGFALRGREWFGCRFGVAGGYGLRPNRPYVFCGFMPLLFPGGRPVL